MTLEQGQETAYGAQIEALQGEAAAIARRGQAKGLRGLVRRATGRAARDRDRAGEIRDSLASIEQRKAEQVQALQARQRGQAASLAARHAVRAAKLEDRIRQERNTREAEDWTPRRGEVRREATTGQEIEAFTEAENLPVERGFTFRAVNPRPRNEQPAHAPPQGQESTPAPEPTATEREAEIKSLLERWQAERDQSRDDNDPGREI